MGSEDEMIGYLKAKAKPQRGGVFLWSEDWDAIVRKLEQLDRENESLRKTLYDVNTIRFNDLGGRK